MQRRPRVFEFAEAANSRGMAEYLCGFLTRMKAAGAEFGVIPAVTPHYCMHEAREISPLPLIDMFTTVNAEIANRRLRRVAVFGTRYSVNSKLFGLLKDAEIITPAPEEVESIHTCYAELLATRRGTKVLHRGMTNLAQRLIDREGLDAIVLAGTDLAVLFNQENTEFPVVDCAGLHLRAIADALTGQ